MKKQGDRLYFRCLSRIITKLVDSKDTLRCHSRHGSNEKLLIVAVVNVTILQGGSVDTNMFAVRQQIIVIGVVFLHSSVDNQELI